MKEILLVSRASRGDREALEELVRLYYEKIYNYIFYRLQDRQTAEDLTQDVFVKLTKSIHLYRPTAKFSAYLYRIAHNTLIDYYRLFVQAEEMPENAASVDSISQVDAKLDAQLMLSRLPEEQRECIELYHLQGLTYREISHVLSIPIPTAKSRVQRGMAACKKMMEEYDERS